MNRNKEQNRGFTLLEIMVSISIILIMAVLISNAFLKKEPEITLVSFRDKLITELRYTQIRSMNSIHNYGINIAANSIILFRDINHSGDHNIGEEIRNISVPEGITLALPSPNIVFRKDGSIFDNTNRIIVINSDVFSRNILVNSLGLIEVVN